MINFTMRFLLFIFTITTFYSCKSTLNNKKKTEINYIPYYLKVYEADSLFLTNNFEKSFKVLDSLFRKIKPLNIQNYNEFSNYIASAAMIKKTDSIDFYIKKGISEFGSIDFFHPNKKEIKAKIQESSKISKVELNQLYKNYNSTKIDRNLEKIILKMYIEDQAARNPIIDTVKMEFYRKKHKKTISKIIKKYGYQNYSKTKFMRDSLGFPIDFTVLFLHQDVEFKKKHLPLLYKNLKKGTLFPNEFGAIVDKIYMKEKKSYYGVIPSYPLLYPKKIDSVRNNIGLPKYGYEKWVDKLLHPQFYK